MFEIVISLMYGLIGFGLASGGITIVDKPVHFILILLCTVIIQNLSRN